MHRQNLFMQLFGLSSLTGRQPLVTAPAKRSSWAATQGYSARQNHNQKQKICMKEEVLNHNEKWQTVRARYAVPLQMPLKRNAGVK
jgi:hypothetical protein